MRGAAWKVATSRKYKPFKVVSEKSNSAMKVFDLADFDMDIVTAVSNELTQEEMAEEGEMFLKRCGQDISLGMLNFGLKKIKGWSPGFMAGTQQNRDISNTNQG